MRGIRNNIVGFLWLLGAAGLANGALSQSTIDGDSLELSPVRDLIADFVRTYPDATLEDAAAFANARAAEYGVNYEFFMLEEPPARTVVLRSGTRRLLAVTPADVDLGACGEFWATLPAVRSGDDRIEIMHQGERISVARPADLLIESMTIFSADGQTVVERIDLPWWSWPLRVLPDGHGIILAFPLGEEAGAWWQRVRAAHTQIWEPYPHLRAQISADGVRFLGDPSAYVNESIERIDDFRGRLEDSYLHRDRFLNSGFVVEYHTPCT
jgi:hypothetical protein